MNKSGYRALWLTCALLFSIIVGVAGGGLAFSREKTSQTLSSLPGESVAAPLGSSS